MYIGDTINWASLKATSKSQLVTSSLLYIGDEDTGLNNTGGYHHQHGPIQHPCTTTTPASNRITWQVKISSSPMPSVRPDNVTSHLRQPQHPNPSQQPVTTVEGHTHILTSALPMAKHAPSATSKTILLNFAGAGKINQASNKPSRPTPSLATHQTF